MNPIMNPTIMPTYARKPVTFVSGKGIWLTDDKDNTYMDMVSGVAVNALGHASPVITEALVSQAQKITHISNLYWNEPQVKLSELLIKLSGGDMQDVFFCNSGTEALEGALKLAKKYGKLNNKKHMLYMKNGFHGRSLGALAITGQSKYQEPFGAMLPNCVEIPFNDSEALAQAFAQYEGDIAAIFIEPIQGEGGIIPIDQAFLNLIKAYSKAHEALLVFDEVQCGAGRTGAYYAYQSLDIQPDIICMAKGLGGGIPIGAILAGKKASLFAKGDHGSTYGGNPLACAVALAVTQTISEPAFLQSVSEKSAHLMKGLDAFKSAGKILDYRGEGLLVGVVVENTEKLVDTAFDNKLLLIAAGSNTVRILPPLNVSIEEIDLLLGKLEEIL
jgi:acetylornithine/N-succinyldiaminopimelate aminotransferase